MYLVNFKLSAFTDNVKNKRNCKLIKKNRSKDKRKTPSNFKENCCFISLYLTLNLNL